MSPAKPLYRRVFDSPSFAVAFAVLLIAAAGWNAALRAMKVVLAKADVPLKRSLEEVPESFGLRFVLARELDSPQGEVRKGKEKMPKDVEETLGTSDYITWYFRDTFRSTNDVPVLVRMHVAYYTGLLDAVPHVPDICYLAGGFQAKGTVDVKWRLPDLPEAWRAWREAPIRRSDFVRTPRTGGKQEVTVFYVFSVNGVPACDRLTVRKMLADPWKKYCYYAKIELSVNLPPGIMPADEQAKVCEAFLAAAAPALFSHFPSAQDIDQLEAGR
jgi:hypothetical protein